MIQVDDATNSEHRFVDMTTDRWPCRAKMSSFHHVFCLWENPTLKKPLVTTTQECSC